MAGLGIDAAKTQDSVFRALSDQQADLWDDPAGIMAALEGNGLSALIVRTQPAGETPPANTAGMSDAEQRQAHLRNNSSPPPDGSTQPSLLEQAEAARAEGDVTRALYLKAQHMAGQAGT